MNNAQNMREWMDQVDEGIVSKMMSSPMVKSAFERAIHSLSNKEVSTAVAGHASQAIEKMTGKQVDLQSHAPLVGKAIVAIFLVLSSLEGGLPAIALKGVQSVLMVLASHWLEGEPEPA